MADDLSLDKMSYLKELAALYFYPRRGELEMIFQNITRKYPEFDQFSAYFKQNFLQKILTELDIIDVKKFTHDLEHHLQQISCCTTAEGFIGF